MICDFNTLGKDKLCQASPFHGHQPLKHQGVVSQKPFTAPTFLMVDGHVVKKQAVKLYLIPNVAPTEIEGADGAAGHPLQTRAGQFLTVAQIEVGQLAPEQNLHAVIRSPKRLG